MTWILAIIIVIALLDTLGVFGPSDSTADAYHDHGGNKTFGQWYKS